jgi:hypothetical protein
LESPADRPYPEQQATMHYLHPPDEPPPGADERVSARNRPRRSAGVTIFVQPDYRGRSGSLRDLSAGGAGLVLDWTTEPGALLFVQLPGMRAGRTRTVAARVVHLTRLPTGQWLAGCRWQSPLSADDVRQAMKAYS